MTSRFWEGFLFCIYIYLLACLSSFITDVYIFACIPIIHYFGFGLGLSTGGIIVGAITPERLSRDKLVSEPGSLVSLVQS